MTQGCVDSNGDPLPLSDECLARIRSLRSKYNILRVSPSPTDLDGDTPTDPDAEDNTMWARTSLDAFLELIAAIPIELVAAVRYKYTANRPSHLVVFGPDNFHMCSCLQLVRRGLPCRHYFTVLVNLIGKTGGPDEIRFDHTFRGACVHNRWRRSGDGGDLPWSVSEVLKSSGHGEGWDGHAEGDDDNFWGPTCEDDWDGIHPSEPQERTARERDAADKRRIFACMMARSKDHAGDIMRSVPLSQALDVHEKLGEYLRFVLAQHSGGTDVKNPAKPPKKGRPKKKKESTESTTESLRQGSAKKAKEEPHNPQGQIGKSRQKRRIKDFGKEKGSRKRAK